MILELFLVVLAILLGLVLYARWNFGTLEKLGIPVVKSHFIFGSTLNSHKTVTHLEDLKRFKEHGSVYGVYEGRLPQVFVCDVDMMKHIMLTDYEHFHSRRIIETGDPIMNEGLDFQPDGKWKALRSMTSPMFSISRIKIMSKSINETVLDYMSGLNEDLDSSGGIIRKYDLFHHMYNMTVDLTARCVFGLKIDNRKDPNNFLAKNLRDFMSPSHNPCTILSSIALTFRFLRKFTPVFDPTASNLFAKTFSKIIEDRRQLLKQGQNQKQDSDLVNQLIQLLDKTDTEEYKRDGVNEFSIIAQAVMFFMAGPDQFSNALTFLTYFLAHNSEAKKRLHAELDKFKAQHNGQVLHENLSELVYTQACIQEVVRLIPPFIRPERVCTKDWEYNGVKIPKGTLVLMPLWAAGRNPEYYEEPEEFRPERWLPENKKNMHPYAFHGFGHGPKNCVATRYNYEVLTMSIAHLHSTYDFKLRDDTQVKFIPGSLLLTSYEPLYFDVVRRAKK